MLPNIPPPVPDSKVDDLLGFISSGDEAKLRPLNMSETLLGFTTIGLSC